MAQSSRHLPSLFVRQTVLYLCSLLLIGGAYFLLLGQLSLRLSSLSGTQVATTNLTGTSLTIELAPIPATVTLPVRVMTTAWSTARLHVIPDDCLHSLTINGLALQSKALPICDYSRGRDLDLSPLLKPGENILVFGLENKSGPGNLRLKPTRTVSQLTVLRLIVCILVLVCSLAYGLSVPPGPVPGILTYSVDLRFILSPASLWIGLTILGGIIVRWHLIPYHSIDINQFLLPWLKFIKSHQGFPALAFGFSDYPPAYLYLLVLVHYCSGLIGPIPLIKLISSAGDLLMAFAVYSLVKSQRPKAAPVCFAALFLAPTVIMNSSMWGQCDSIYAAFVVLSLAALLNNRMNRAFILLGVALCFKLQAIFVVPLFLVLCLSGQCAWSRALLTPLVFLISLIPSWVAGRPLIELLLIYAGQVGSYSKLSFRAPTIFSWIPNSQFEQLVDAGLVFGLTIIVLASLALAWRWRVLTRDRVMTLAFLFCVLCPFVLPKMHERYFYLADVLSIPFAAYFPAWWFLPVFMQISSGFCYFPFLLRTTVVPIEILTFVTCTVVAATLYQTHRLWTAEQTFPRQSGQDPVSHS